MSLRIRIFIVITVIIMLIMMTNMIKKRKIDLRESLIWYVLCFVVLILDAFPNILIGLASILGIAVPSNMVFMVAIAILIVTVFTLTATISKLSNKVRKLTQEVALLKEEIREAKK